MVVVAWSPSGIAHSHVSAARTWSPSGKAAHSHMSDARTWSWELEGEGEPCGPDHLSRSTKRKCEIIREFIFSLLGSLSQVGI